MDAAAARQIFLQRTTLNNGQRIKQQLDQAAAENFRAAFLDKRREQMQREKNKHRYCRVAASEGKYHPQGSMLRYGPSSLRDSQPVDDKDLELMFEDDVEDMAGVLEQMRELLRTKQRHRRIPINPFAFCAAQNRLVANYNRWTERVDDEHDDMQWKAWQLDAAMNARKFLRDMELVGCRRAFRALIEHSLDPFREVEHAKAWINWVADSW